MADTTNHMPAIWSSGFLPASHQGVLFQAGKEPIRDLFADPAVPVSHVAP